jgi:hypothetical protein
VARDLTLLLDVMAGPDPLTLGVAYALTLPPARHQQLSDFRDLVLEHPLIATESAPSSTSVARHSTGVGDEPLDHVVQEVR